MILSVACARFSLFEKYHNVPQCSFTNFQLTLVGEKYALVRSNSRTCSFLSSLSAKAETYGKQQTMADGPKTEKGRLV